MFDIRDMPGQRKTRVKKFIRATRRIDTRPLKNIKQTRVKNLAAVRQAMKK